MLGTRAYGSVASHKHAQLESTREKERGVDRYGQIKISVINFLRRVEIWFIFYKILAE